MAGPNTLALPLTRAARAVGTRLCPGRVCEKVSPTPMTSTPLSRLLWPLLLACPLACSSDHPRPLTSPAPAPGGPPTVRWPDDDLAALIGKMTFAEKVAQLGIPAPAIERLGLPAHDYWNECLHGVVTSGATSFPQAIALASTWDPDLVHQVASAISTEARAFHATQGKALTYFAPVINMLRDPRWGRYEESYSEDPWLMARTAVAFVRGLQGDDPRFLKVVATPKHYAGNNAEFDRHSGSSDIDEQLLHEYYLPAFAAAVGEGGAYSVMAAYNAVNGVPAPANPTLLEDILRGSWSFPGYVVSDCDAIEDIAYTHHWTDSLAEAAARALLAGTDLNCGSTYPTQLQSAFAQGLIAESDVDRALGRVLRARFLLGELGPAAQDPYRDIGADAIASDAHTELAREAARAAIVLLKNEASLLPLDATTLPSIAVIGPHAADVTLGGYSGAPNASHMVSALTAITSRLARTGATVRYAEGGTVTGPADPDAVAAAVEAAGSSAVAVVLVGTSQDVLCEGMDRPDWSLPGEQAALIQAVYAANPRTVVVLVTAGPLGVDWAQAHVPAILTAFYDGQDQGTAIADVLFGDYNPGGKLTSTWYTETATLPPIDDYDLRKGRTYLYYQGQPLYPFGFGLSYTTFAYDNLQIAPAAITATDSTTITVDVTNTGARAGDEVVQLYLHDVVASVPRPLRELRGFQRVHIAPGRKVTVSFPLHGRDLAFWDTTSHAWKVEDGRFDVAIGSSSADLRVRGSLTVGAVDATDVVDASSVD